MANFFRKLGFIHVVLSIGLFLVLAVVLSKITDSPIDEETLQRINDSNPQNMVALEKNRIQVLFMQERIWFFLLFSFLVIAIMTWIGIKSQQPGLNSYASYHFRLNESINKRIKQQLEFDEQLKLKFNTLTPNDLLIAEMLVDGLSSKEISSELNISPASVNTARYRLRKKMGLHSDVDLVDFLMKI